MCVNSFKLTVMDFSFQILRRLFFCLFFFFPESLSLEAMLKNKQTNKIRVLFK